MTTTNGVLCESGFETEDCWGMVDLGDVEFLVMDAQKETTHVCPACLRTAKSRWDVESCPGWGPRTCDNFVRQQLAYEAPEDCEDADTGTLVCWECIGYC